MSAEAVGRLTVKGRFESELSAQPFALEQSLVAVSSMPSLIAVLRRDRRVGQRLLSACFANGPCRPQQGAVKAG
jgi:hypothetical protein